MGSIKDMIEDGMEELEDDLDETFTWKGASVPCVPSDLARGTVVVSGGKEWVVGFSLYVRKANFITADNTLITVDSTLYTVDNATPTPVAGKTLTFRGREYRILTVTEDPSRAYYKLDLADSNSGR